MKARSLTIALGALLVAGLTQMPGSAQEVKETLSQSYRGSKARDWEFQKVAPIKVFDNLYYVGPGNVSVWLIPTTDGLILFDATQEAVLAYCDSMTREIHVPAETFAPVRAALDERCLVELTATIGAYNMVSRFIEALGIDSKDDLSTKEAGSHVQP